MKSIFIASQSSKKLENWEMSIEMNEIGATIILKMTYKIFDL